MELERNIEEIPLPQMRHCSGFGRRLLERELWVLELRVVVEELQLPVCVDNFAEHFRLALLNGYCYLLPLRHQGCLDRMGFHLRR